MLVFLGTFSFVSEAITTVQYGFSVLSREQLTQNLQTDCKLFNDALCVADVGFE
jgi:hypothetical protein